MTPQQRRLAATLAATRPRDYPRNGGDLARAATVAQWAADVAAVADALTGPGFDRDRFVAEVQA